MKRRAYTMVELVIGLTLTFTLLLVGVAWLSTLMRTSASAVEQRASVRDAGYLKTRLGDDLAATRPCAVDQSGWSFATVSSTKLAFYADVVDGSGVAGQDGLADLVVWTADGTSVLRGVVRGTGTCPLPESGAVSGEVVPDITQDDAPIFESYAPDGSVVDELVCRDAGTRCDVSSVRVRLVVHRTIAGDAPTRLDATLQAARTGRWAN